jgi:hypothetical protein
VSASISVGDGIAWESLEQAARDAGETWPDVVAAERPVPAEARSIDMRAATLALIGAYRESLDEMRRSLLHYRGNEVLNAHDAESAFARNHYSLGELLISAAATWRAHAERLERDIEATERELAECEVMFEARLPGPARLPSATTLDAAHGIEGELRSPRAA